MTVKQAENNGLHFTGVWERSYEKDKVKERAKQIREKYNCKAVVVNDNGGIAVYADDKYHDLKQIEDMECKLRLIPLTKQRLLEQLAELEAEEKRLHDKIEEIRNLY